METKVDDSIRERAERAAWSIRRRWSVVASVVEISNLTGRTVGSCFENLTWFPRVRERERERGFRSAGDLFFFFLLFFQSVPSYFPLRRPAEVSRPKVGGVVLFIVGNRSGIGFTGADAVPCPMFIESLRVSWVRNSPPLPPRLCVLRDEQYSQYNDDYSCWQSESL